MSEFVRLVVAVAVGLTVMVAGIVGAVELGDTVWWWVPLPAALGALWLVGRLVLRGGR